MNDLRAVDDSDDSSRHGQQLGQRGTAIVYRGFQPGNFSPTPFRPSHTTPNVPLPLIVVLPLPTWERAIASATFSVQFICPHRHPPLGPSPDHTVLLANSVPI